MQKHEYKLFALYHLDPFFTEMDLDLNNEHFSKTWRISSRKQENLKCMFTFYGDVLRAFQQVIDLYDIKAVFNEDWESDKGVTIT